MRRSIIIGIVILIAVIVGVLFFIFRSPEEESSVGPGTFPTVGEPTGPGGVGIAPGFFDDPIDAGERPVEAAPRLIKITDGPVAAGVVALGAGTTTSAGIDARVRYIERASGNMYEYRSDGKTITRITNRTIPGVVEASWLADGSRAYVRYFSSSEGGARHLETYTLPAVGEGQILARDLLQVAPEASGSVIVVTSSQNGLTASRAGAGGIGGKALFSSALTRLFIFPTEKGLFAHTPASAQADSYAFSIAENGSVTRISAPTRGMAALPSPDGSKLLVSHQENDAIVLAVIDTRTKERTALPLSTFTEKCTWSSDSARIYCGVPSSPLSGNLPDDWYQGVVGFRDQIWRIDFETRLALFVADLPALTEAPIDATSLAVDPQGQALFFTNRNDGSLWAYEL